MLTRHFFSALLDPYHSLDEDLALAPEELRSRKARHAQTQSTLQRPQAQRPAR